MTRASHILNAVSNCIDAYIQPNIFQEMLSSQLTWHNSRARLIFARHVSFTAPQTNDFRASLLLQIETSDHRLFTHPIGEKRRNDETQIDLEQLETSLARVCQQNAERAEPTTNKNLPIKYSFVEVILCSSHMPCSDGNCVYMCVLKWFGLGNKKNIQCSTYNGFWWNGHFGQTHRELEAFDEIHSLVGDESLQVSSKAITVELNYTRGRNVYS